MEQNKVEASKRSEEQSRIFPVANESLSEISQHSYLPEEQLHPPKHFTLSENSSKKNYSADFDSLGIIYGVNLHQTRPF